MCRCVSSRPPTWTVSPTSKSGGPWISKRTRPTTSMRCVSPCIKAMVTALQSFVVVVRHSNSDAQVMCLLLLVHSSHHRIEMIWRLRRQKVLLCWSLYFNAHSKSLYSIGCTAKTLHKSRAAATGTLVTVRLAVLSCYDSCLLAWEATHNLEAGTCYVAIAVAIVKHGVYLHWCFLCTLTLGKPVK